jgi:flagellar operon protein
MSEIRFPVGSPIVIPAEPSKNGTAVEKGFHPSFDSVLSREVGRGEVKLSAHARNRLNERGVDLTGENLLKVKEAMQLLESKGGRDSLVLMGSTALIVNIPNRTVVTAMEAGNVFTNIDSAAVISY